MTDNQIEAKLELLRDRREDLYLSISDAEKNVRHAKEHLARQQARLERVDTAIEELEHMEADEP